MKEIWLSRCTKLVFMALFGKFVGFFNAVKVRFRVVFLYCGNDFWKWNFNSPAFRLF